MILIIIIRTQVKAYKKAVEDLKVFSEIKKQAVSSVLIPRERVVPGVANVAVEDELKLDPDPELEPELDPELEAILDKRAPTDGSDDKE